MPIDVQSQEFMRALVASQRRLFAYVTTLLGSTERAQDVLQKANVVMIEKMDEFNATKQEFVPWALKVCYFEVLADRRDRSRDKLTFGAEILESLADVAAQRTKGFDERRRVLDGCLEKLPPQHREMIERRYSEGGSVEMLAQAMERPAASISQTLYRIRVALLDCVRRNLAVEAVE